MTSKFYWPFSFVFLLFLATGCFDDDPTADPLVAQLIGSYTGSCMMQDDSTGQTETFPQDILVTAHRTDSYDTLLINSAKFYHVSGTDPANEDIVYHRDFGNREIIFSENRTRMNYISFRDSPSEIDCWLDRQD